VQSTRGDHSSRPRLAPRLQQPTRGLLFTTACAVVKEALFRVCESRSASRAGSPLLFGLAPRGVFRASDVAIGAVGSYPTFSPLPNETSVAKASHRFTCAMPPSCSAGGLLSVALSVSCTDNTRQTSHPTEPLPRRYLARCPFALTARKAPRGSFVTGLASLRRWCPDFPPVRLSYGSQTDDHPAHPLSTLYRHIKDLRANARKRFSTIRLEDPYPALRLSYLLGGD